MLATLLFIPVWFVLMLVSTNLVGYVVRGLFPPSLPVGDSSDGVTAMLKQEASRYYLASFVIAMLAIGLTCSFLYALSHYWNVGLAIAAGMLMLSRLPDLFWQIQNGIPQSIHELPKTGIYFVANVLMWLAIPVIWYSLYVGRV